MWNRIFEFISKRAETIQLQYSINPYIFLILLTACAPLFYYSMFRIAKSAVRREPAALSRWSAVFLAATSTPYVYVLLFGRNMPWWIYLVLGLLIAQGSVSLVRKLRANRGTSE